MAVSSGILSGFVSGGTASMVPPSSSLRLVAPVFPHSFSTRRDACFLTLVAVSKPATDTKKREPRGIMKPRPVSPEMQAFLGGVTEIPRTEALKQIWAYIKHHNLQDPADKKVIVCDEQLKKIFGGRERVGFLEIAGLISPHFLK